MLIPKGGKHILQQILFGKYQIISILGTGSFGTVYLSKHLTLESYRAIKTLPKHTDSPISLLAEAQLLKALHHPGIPIIYDIEEDSCNYYFIEEYVDGVPLDDYLLQQSHISPEFFFNISLQLCDIFTYLHTLTPYPLVYLDLKPEHIIVCESQIKLIDFNVATFLSKEGNIYNLFGNKDFSAPELFSGIKPNPSCDIYSIGKIMQLMSNYVKSPLLPNIHQIFKKATHKNPSCRYETVRQLSLDLQTQQTNQLSHLRTTIAVLASQPGCGCTHFSVSLVSALNHMGFSACYYEKNNSNRLRQMQNTDTLIREKEGLICHKTFRGYPQYGETIILPDDCWEFCIYDYGCCIPTDNVSADITLYVCSDSLWHLTHSLDVGATIKENCQNMYVICNMGNTKTMSVLAKHCHSKVFRYPYYPDPFHTDAFMVSFVFKLLQQKRRFFPFFSFGNRLLPKK